MKFEFDGRKSEINRGKHGIDFCRGEDVTHALDLSKARRPGQQPRRVNVDFPEWMIGSLDKEAKRLGATRQSIIKVWIADRLEKASA